MSTGATGPFNPIPLRLSKFASAPPRPIATLDELITSHDAIVNKETKDRGILSQLSNPNRNEVRKQLLAWTSRGFPTNFVIFSISVIPPQVCSDGTSRNFTEYVSYLLETTIDEKLLLLQPQLVGISISYTIFGNTIRVQVSHN